MIRRGTPQHVRGLTLSKNFYRHAVAPILRRHFPRLSYSAALVGPGSEVQGFDDARSADHDFGPRLQLFLSEAQAERRRAAITGALGRELPVTFCGYSTHFTQTDAKGGRIPVEGRAGDVDHGVDIWTVEGFFRRYLSVGAAAKLSETRWLSLPPQNLREVTGGRIFHDGLPELARARRRFAFYPRRVWLELMARRWTELDAEEPFVGRAGECGDDLGSRLVAARQVYRLVELALLMERVYRPYDKWLGTAFARLRCARRLAPLLGAALAAEDWKTRQVHLARAYEAAARMHNRLGVTPRLSPRVRPFHTRPFPVLDAARFANALRATMRHGSFPE